MNQAIINKTNELEQELKEAGLWQHDVPCWVQGYDDKHNMREADFAQWLQFVFVPNLLKKPNPVSNTEKKLLVPQAMKYFGDDLKKGNLLQVLIEIDALI